MRFSVKVENERLETPVSVSLDGIDHNTDKGILGLYEITPGGPSPIPSQIESGYSSRLWFVLPASENKQAREFFLKLEKKPVPESEGEKVIIKKDHQDLSLFYNESPILKYRYGITYPPKGVDPVYKRSGFIHPLWSPGGEVLTRIQPSDHYHHYGIWGPWTKTHVEGREVDFWNLGKGQGTVRFWGFLSEEEGQVFSGFRVLQHHIDFGAKGEDQIAMNEVLEVRVWNLGEKVWMIDYTTTLNCPLDSGVLLDAYRYGGGIGFRATEKWNKDNCKVFTSEHKTRRDADGSSARWCVVEGRSDNRQGRSGILFMSHPSNRMHPEPMRVWPHDANGGRGDMFFEFSPIRHEEWRLKQRKNYTLKYRMVVFEGEMDAQVAECYWSCFASDLKIMVTDL